MIFFMDLMNVTTKYLSKGREPYDRQKSMFIYLIPSRQDVDSTSVLFFFYVVARAHAHAYGSRTTIQASMFVRRKKAGISNYLIFFNTVN